MRAVGKGKTVVWRWQERFMHEGVRAAASRYAGMVAVHLDAHTDSYGYDPNEKYNGIERLPTADRSRKRLEAWLNNELRPWFSDRLLDVDEDVFVVWRRLVEKGKAIRHTFPQPDLFIAATAVLHDLCAVTRNAGDSLLTAVPVLSTMRRHNSRTRLRNNASSRHYRIILASAARPTSKAPSKKPDRLAITSLPFASSSRAGLPKSWRNCVKG
jgi:hypothetical protein